MASKPGHNREDQAGGAEGGPQPGSRSYGELFASGEFHLTRARRIITVGVAAFSARPSVASIHVRQYALPGSWRRISCSRISLLHQGCLSVESK